MSSSPLRIHDIDCNKLNRQSLEYLHSSLMDQNELSRKIRQTLLRSNYQVRIREFHGNLNHLAQLNDNGGCKILQFMAHCCNPLQLDYENGLDHIYYDLTKHIENPLNEEYVLMEMSGINIIDGEWIPKSQLAQVLPSNDIMIVLSPNHKQMTQLFMIWGIRM